MFLNCYKKKQKKHFYIYDISTLSKYCRSKTHIQNRGAAHAMVGYISKIVFIRL